MFKNFLITAWRNIYRKKVFSILNIGGLALGMTACIIMLLFVRNEFSFDHLHKKGDRIYRLNEVQRFNGMPEQTVAYSMYPMAPALANDYPEIENYTRIYRQADVTLKNNDKQVRIPQLLCADSTFLQVFDFPLLHGNRTTALQDPNAIILTEQTANKLFNGTDVIGQTISINTGKKFADYKITAVIKDVPDNSHIQFDCLIPLSSVPKEDWMQTWDANWVNTYLLLKEHANPVKLKSVLPAFKIKYLKDQAKAYDLLLQPLFSIHLNSESITHDYLNYKKFSKSYVNIFLILSGFVLLIAIFNFINLSTARATGRAKEVGVRKTIGAGRWELIKQFTGEAIFLTLLALLITMILIKISLPLLSRIINRDIQFIPGNPLNWLILTGFVITVGFAAGIYPAFIISSFQPVKVLKGLVDQANKKFTIRNALVVIQFVIAIGLIISTAIAIQQLAFIKNKKLGFDKDMVITIPLNATANKNIETLKNELQKNPGIINITASSQELGNNINQMGADYISDKGEKKHMSVSHLIVDYNFIPFYDIQLREGRNFSQQYATDKQFSYIINQTLANEMDIKNPVGAHFAAAWEKQMGTIIGVVKDFNFNSLHNKVAPLYISIQNWDYNRLSIKLKPENVESTVQYISQKWQALVPDMPFSWSFLDEHLSGLYETDKQVSQVVKIATILAIIIACLGLFGIALYNIETRKKEIGIRKVLGAGVPGIVALLSKQFLKPVVIALLISAPLAWWMMSKWLQDFAYRISISAWVFVLAGITAILIALLTIGFQAIKAAVANPVKSLRSE